MRVLIVKVSSLGDIIHTLPAVTDAWRAKRGLRFDWVVEEAFTEIPAWHPAVDRVIPVALRRWRKEPWRAWRSGEFAQFKQQLQEVHYDLVIDAQGLIKSGLISRIARGLTVGLSTRTIREPLATMFYNMVYAVPWQQHAVERVRDLFSRSFNYSLDYRACEYGLDLSRISPQPPPCEDALVFLHGTTWRSKQWPEHYWRRLARLAGAEGYRVRLPWGNAEERERAERIAAGLPNAQVLDRLTLSEVARLMLGSRGVVAVDTGLAHLAAALSLPVVAIYGSSSPELTGTYGRRQLHLKSGLACSPCLNKACSYSGPIQEEVDEGATRLVSPPCYGDNPPELVWERTKALMAGGAASLDAVFYP